MEPTIASVVTNTRSVHVTKLKMTPGYLYIFTGESFLRENKFKIGKTVNPSSRISALCTSCPDGRFVGVFPCRNMDQVEAFIHKDIKDKRWEKEWFFFDTQISVVNYVQSRLLRYDGDTGDYPPEWTPESSKDGKVKNIAAKKTPNEKLKEDCKIKTDKLDAHLLKSSIDEEKLRTRIATLQTELVKKIGTNSAKSLEMRSSLEGAIKKYNEVCKDENLGMFMGLLNTLFMR